MAKKSTKSTEEEKITLDNIKIDRNFIEDLIKDTNFVMADEGSLMNSRKKVTTPLYVINCIYGGGLPLSIISRISGHPGSGKSTFSYQTMANYQKEFPDGISVIYDMEASMDNSRLQVLGVDTSKVLRLPATSLEMAFEQMFKMLGKLKDLYDKNPNISTFQIYDTISSGGTETQHEQIESGGNAFGAGPMMQSNRIIKQNLMNIPPYIEKLPVFLGLLEQVFTQINQYGGASYGAGKNFGLEHACHAHIEFGKPKDEYDKRSFLIGTTSNVTLKKSKLSPKFIDIPCYIDVTQGGKIDEIESFLRYISTDSIGIIKASSWWTLTDTLDELSKKYPSIESSIKIAELTKSYRKTEFVDMIKENTDLINLLQVRLIDIINSIYPGQEIINNEYRLKLMNECKYFDNLEV